MAGDTTDTDVPGGAKPPAGARRWESSKLVPTIAVVTVVVAAVATTVMVTYSEHQASNRPSPVSMSAPEVVRAPPLVVTAPPLNAQTGAGRHPQHQAGGGRVASNALGAGPACRNCGVVESVGRGKDARAFQLRVRMDDGTLRTVEQGGPVTAGSRVVLEGGTVRPVTGERQG